MHFQFAQCACRSRQRFDMGQRTPRCLPIYVLENGFGGHATPDAAGEVADTPLPLPGIKSARTPLTLWPDGSLASSIAQA